MELPISEHFEKFNMNPVIIRRWNNMDTLRKLIEKAIEDNKPYNEYDLLSDEEKKAFDDGSLLF